MKCYEMFELKLNGDEPEGILGGSGFKGNL